MADKLGILVIRGMGDQDEDFHEEFEEDVRKRIRANQRVIVEPIHWAPVLSDKALELWKNLNEPRGLDFRRARKFFLHYFADASAYQQVNNRNNATYAAIHQKVHDAIARLSARLEGEDPGDQAPEPRENQCPILVIAHSLGCHIMSNYIWDRQHWVADGENGRGPDPLGGTAFERMETLAGMMTFGSNLPFFTLAFDPVLPIELPGPAVPGGVEPLARWINFYDEDDVLGWPVKPIFLPHLNSMNAAQRKTVEIMVDRQINVGGFLVSWNPLSHTKYWTDRDVTKPIGEYIDEIVAALG